MTPRYRNWTVRGYLRPVMDWTPDGEPLATGAREVAVAVIEPDGREWHVTVDSAEGRTRLTSLTMQGQPITPASLREVPVGYLTSVAAAYVAEVEAHLADAPDAPLWQALTVSEREPGQVLIPGDPPTPQAFAEQWRATPDRSQISGVWLPRRQALATHYGVSEYTIDKWTRAARDAGLIDRSKVGRRRTQTSGGKPAGTRERKNRK